MSKKIIGLLLIMAILLTSGCTSNDKGAKPTATPQPAQPTISPVPSNTSASQDNATAGNESMPELDLPLPPDLSDI